MTFKIFLLTSCERNNFRFSIFLISVSTDREIRRVRVGLVGRCCSLVFNSDHSKVVDPHNDDKNCRINSVFIILDSCNLFQTVLFWQPLASSLPVCVLCWAARSLPGG